MTHDKPKSSELAENTIAILHNSRLAVEECNRKKQEYIDWLRSKYIPVDKRSDSLYTTGFMDAIGMVLIKAEDML